MAKKQVTVRVTSGTAVGPYNVYKTSISEDNLFESNVSLANMQTGKIYRVDSSISTIIVTNQDDDCCCGVKVISI